jgi:sulfoxide reductase heme-binding subunit YedZ
VARTSNRMWYLVLIGFVALVLVGGLISLEPYGTPLNWFTRGAALLGYLAVFLAIISSAYMRKLVRFFGRPFIKVHHRLSVAGLVLLTLHPLGVAWASASLRILLPRFGSWTAFLQWGGAPAWFLIAIASLTAVLRKTIGQNWRVIHVLNYVAFLLGTVHAFMIGTDLQRTIVKAIPVVLALAVAETFVHRRFQRRRR